jgi:hypothetical protein
VQLPHIASGVTQAARTLAAATPDLAFRHAIVGAGHQDNLVG